MKKIFFSLFSFALIFLFFCSNTINAGWVNGYWKKDGAYVSGYWRSDPNALKYDNYGFDGDWSDAFNESYYSSDRNYSSDWYTPTWITQDDYWTGKSFYEMRHSYDDYSYDTFDYDYDYWDDPIYEYTPTYDYGYDPIELYESSYEYEPYEPYEYEPYEYEPLYKYEPYEPYEYEPYGSSYDDYYDPWDY